MAERLFFQATESDKSKYYKEELASFTYFSGFAISQKQKSVRSLHESIKDKYPNLQILEISTKSEEPLGVRLSAFNLMYFDESSGEQYHLENVFQASKEYENGGPYLDMLTLSPKDAKGDTRHHTSGRLKDFRLDDWRCPLEPKTMFYDWIYCKALSQNKEVANRLLAEGYNTFTDIEFNHNKSINCQARAVAIFVSLSKTGRVEEFLNHKELWVSIYSQSNDNSSSGPVQLTLDLFG